MNQLRLSTALALIFLCQALAFSQEEKEDSVDMQELVITGYSGQMQRTRLTSNVATVKNDQLTVGSYANAADALAGQVAGLKVVQSGNPFKAPTITLRGGTEWYGTGNPLYVIDGCLRDNMEGINPQDIERIDILKDASATAIYGARANNGVLLITTRKGAKGKASVGFSTKIGLSYLNNPYEPLSTEEFITYMRRGFNHNPENASLLTQSGAAGTGNTYGADMLWNLMPYSANYDYLLQQGWKTMTDPINPNQTLMYRSTDIESYNINTPAVSQEYNAYVEGGSDRGSYYVGLGYNDTEGLPKNVYSKRYSAQFNGSYRINKVVSTDTRFGFTRTNGRELVGYTNEYNYFQRTLFNGPTARYEDENGNQLLGVSAGDGNQSYQADKLHFDNERNQFNMTEQLTFDIIDGLKLQTMMSWLYKYNTQSTFYQDYEASAGKYNRSRNTSEYYNKDFSQTYNATLNYKKLFNYAHDLDVMVGMEYYDKSAKGFSASGSGAITDDFADLALTTSDANKRSIDSWHSTYRIMSYFGRLNYAYESRYLLSLTARYDGYSSLQNNRWGFFPGVSAGWVFSREQFMQNATSAWLDLGKLRVSYGENGNATGIGAYDLQGAYTTLQYAGNLGYALTTLPNLGLRWEKSHTFEVGLDLSFFNRRLTADVTYYNRLTSDKYAAQTLPESTGYSSIKTNNGEIRNTGVEINLNGVIIDHNDWRWTAGLNIAYNKNKVVTLPSNGLTNNRQNAVEVYTGDGTQTTWIGGLQEGQEPGAIIGYHYLGVFTDASQIPAGLQYYNTFTGKWFTPEVGDAIWEDINGDNKIDAKDRKQIGHTMPHWTGGINTSLSWRDLRLYARFDYALDYHQYDASLAMLTMSCNNNLNTTTFVRDTYSESNTSASYPRFLYWDPGYHDNYFRVSDIFTKNASYLMLRELQLSYTLPQQVLKKFFCKDLTISVTGQNLFWWTKTTCNTPESMTNANYSALNGAFNSSTAGGYPLPRAVVFGLNLKF